MPPNKNALLRYNVLDKCFRNTGRRFFIEDLIEECSVALERYTGSIDGISLRTVQNDIKFMESEEGYSIDLARLRDGKRVYYRYEDTSFSIHKTGLSEDEAARLRETLLTLARFKGLPQFGWVNEMITRLESAFNLSNTDTTIIEFDQNLLLRGLDHLDSLFSAINNKQGKILIYKGVKMSKAKAYVFSPHYLKQYNNRWFVLGQVEGLDGISNFALDRIQDVLPSEAEYIGPPIDYGSYFQNVIGVTVSDAAVQTISFEVSNSLLPYISSKPLHASQTVNRSGESNIVTIKVIPNYELESLVLSYGEGLKVVGPGSFKGRIAKRINEMYQQIN